MKAWEQHIAGAAALLKLRGKQQFQTERGLRLFVSLRNQLVRKRMPDRICTRADVMTVYLLRSDSKTFARGGQSVIRGPA